jgi:tryptophan halogenase
MTPDTLGVGYAFSSRHMSDDEAATTLLSDHVGKTPLAMRTLSFRSGYRKHFWIGNCVAIGASAGFLEPLEPVALQMTQSGIATLIGLFPDRSCSAGESTEYSRLMGEDYARLTDMVIMRYVVASRDDTAFWREVRACRPPALLAHKLRLFSARGSVAVYDNEIFHPSYWVSALLGNGQIPAFHDRLADNLDLDETCRKLDDQRLSVAEMVAAMPQYERILKRLNANG